MRVLMIADCDDKYGAPHSLCQMVEMLKLKDNVNITVVLNRESSISAFLRKIGCKVLIVNYAPYCIGYPYMLWKLPFKVFRDGVKYYYGYLFALKQLQKELNIKEFDLIHANSSREDFGAIISEKYNIPLIWHFRELGNSHYQYFSLRNDYIQLMNRTSTFIIAVSDVVRKYWINKGIDDKKIIRIYNGVKFHQFSKNQSIPLTRKKEIKLVMIGSLQPSKGQTQAVELMNCLKGSEEAYHLDLIGDGAADYLSYLMNIVKDNNLEESVRFLGYRSDIEDLLPNYDVGLICSKNEGFGRVTAEYMMAGLPVLASNTGANSELIREGVDGYLYSYENIEDMKEKLMRIIGHNLGGENTHKYAVNNFSAKVNAENVYRVYKKVLGEN